MTSNEAARNRIVGGKADSAPLRGKIQPANRVPREYARIVTTRLVYAFYISSACTAYAYAETPDTSDGPDTAISRPATTGMFRWQEDWSVLADPAISPESGDFLKYLPLVYGDPKSYLSFGITLRERLESNDAPFFGVRSRPSQVDLLHRLQLHLDAHFNEQARVFVQVENALAPGIEHPGPADANRLDLRLLFFDYSDKLGDGLYKIRIGRQEMAFDLQRFVAVRDGANVRQAFDAVWGDYELGKWRITGFQSQPVQYRNDSDFDDFSNSRFTYGGLRVQRQDVAGGELSATISHYQQDSATFLAGSGVERREIGDVRYALRSGSVDADVEAMIQGGSIGNKDVRAWAFGSIFGYTLSTVAWKPRVGLQVDEASGDHDLHDQTVGTFNPLFPNGYYVTLSAYTGFTNFIHVKPSMTFMPTPRIKLLVAVGGLWRQTTSDAIYVQPDIPVPGTAGVPGRRSSTYGELRFDWTLDRRSTLALEADHYSIGPALVHAGGHNSDYVMVEYRWAW